MVWSQAGVTQVVGRANRFGQKKTVHVYIMAALGSTDVLMRFLASDKHDMLEALMTKEPNHGISQFILNPFLLLIT